MELNQLSSIVTSRAYSPQVILVLAVLLSGCVTSQNVKQIDLLESRAETPRVLLMPPDIKYYLLTAGGVPEPNAEWTESARKNFTVAISNFASSIGSDLKIIDPDSVSETELQYERLHSAVGLTILNHHYGQYRLPSKNMGEVFNWSLGPEISALAAEESADYALFVYYRDYQASGGRVAFALLAAVAGASVPIGSESGFASLVDLRTGDIVWFNVVIAGSGELREASGAVAAVNALFKDIPTAKGSNSVE